MLSSNETTNKTNLSSPNSTLLSGRVLQRPPLSTKTPTRKRNHTRRRHLAVKAKNRSTRLHIPLAKKIQKTLKTRTRTRTRSSTIATRVNLQRSGKTLTLLSPTALSRLLAPFVVISLVQPLIRSSSPHRSRLRQTSHFLRFANAQLSRDHSTLHCLTTSPFPMTKVRAAK